MRYEFVGWVKIGLSGDWIIVCRDHDESRCRKCLEAEAAYLKRVYAAPKDAWHSTVVLPAGEMPIGMRKRRRRHRRGY